MQSRKAAADAGDAEEPTIMRGWGKNPPPDQQDEVHSSSMLVINSCTHIWIRAI